MSEKVVGASGPVSIGPLALVVQELSVQGEVGLLKLLRANARKALGPGSFYTNIRPTLEWLQKQGMHAERAHLLEVTGRLVASGAGVSDDAMWEYRQTPDGVADELYARTRATHPEATREELRAVLNEANALEVHLAIQDALDPEKKG